MKIFGKSTQEQKHFIFLIMLMSFLNKIRAKGRTGSAWKCGGERVGEGGSGEK
jgi:hypothetical protein